MNIFLWVELKVTDKKGKVTATKFHPMSSWETPWPLDLLDYLQKKCDRLNDKPALRTSDTQILYYVGNVEGTPYEQENVNC